MATRSLRRPTKPRRLPEPLSQIAYIGMRDSMDASAADPRKASLIQNAYPQDADLGGGLVGRPGMRRSGTQKGSVGNRQGQLRAQYTKTDGTEWTIDIIGGLVYSWDWTTRAHTAITAGAPTISPTARLYYTLYANQLIVSDGVNKPWALSEAGGVWTFISLTNAPVAYGAPTVYFAKLFFINAANRKEIQWSEEGALNTGYTAGGFNNAWELVQTEQEPLYAIVGTEQALYYFRARSISFVSGEVTTDFASTGTQEGVSSTVGTTSPGSVLINGGWVWFIDADAHPQRFAIGGSVQDNPPLWQEARETTRRLPRNQLNKADACYWQPGNLVLFGVVGFGVTVQNTILCFDATSGQFVGIWRGFAFTWIGMVKDADLVPVLVHADADGYAYDFGHPQGSLWTDSVGGVTTAIEHAVTASPMGYSVNAARVFEGIDITLRLTSNLTGMVFDYLTPDGFAPTSVIPTIAGTFTVWGTMVWGVDFWTSLALEKHLQVGFTDEGRWIAPRLRHGGLGEQFGFIGWTIDQIYTGRVPEMM